MKMMKNSNTTVGGSLTFPWTDGKFGKGSITGPDSFPNHLGKPVKGTRTMAGGKK